MTTTNPTTEPRVRMVCSFCGSTHVVRDAWAAWDEDTQTWVLENVFDAAQCDHCEGDSHIEEEPITEGDPPRCQGCGRVESVCSAEPCADVLADRKS